LKRTPQERSKPQDPTVVVHEPTNLQDEIQRRAYEIYEEHGMMGGSEIDDWLQAEAELRSETARKAA
jgi:hypothetical protein